MSSSKGQGSEDFYEILEGIEEFREELLGEIRARERRIESGLENSNKIENIRIFSRVPQENEKALQLLAASITLDEKILEKLRVPEKYREKLKNYRDTINSRQERYFPEHNSEHFWWSNKVVFKRLPAEMLSELEVPPEISEVMRPLIEYMFSEDIATSFEAYIAHEGTHSWLSKNSKKSGEQSKELVAAEEGLCYTTNFIASGHLIQGSDLVDENLPSKDKVAWSTQLLAERLEYDDLDLDWIRETGKEMYSSESRRENPFRFLFEKALTENEEKVISRYKYLVENSLKPVFQELSQVIEDVETESLNSGGKISLRRAKQIEEEVEWHEPEKAEQRMRETLYERCEEKRCRHREIERMIRKIVEEKSETLAEYAEMVSLLEDSLRSEEILEEADQVKEDLMNTSSQFAAAD